MHCHFCRADDAAYACPQCGVDYCSLRCYQCAAHLDCSEKFYRKEVEAEIQLRATESNSDGPKKVLAALKRLDEANTVPEADSEDDEEADLELRLAGMDLDDADGVWSRLTEQERQDFESLLQSGQIQDLIPAYQPWWIHRIQPQLVTELHAPDETGKILAECPPILDAIQPLSQLSRHQPAPCVKFNLANTIFSYVYCLRLFRGQKEGDEDVLQFLSALLKVCGNLSAHENFSDVDQAVKAVIMRANDQSDLRNAPEFQQTCQKDCFQILNGPSNEKSDFYLLAALSDLKRTIADGLQRLKAAVKASRTPIQLDKTTLKKANLKIDYYLGYILDFNHELHPLRIDMK